MTHIRSKKMFIKKLLAISFLVTFLLTPALVFAQQQTNSNTVTTKVGNPKTVSGGWPTTGILTQGPKGALDHVNIFNGSGAEAVDIANSTGTPIHTTFAGTVIATHDCSAAGDCTLHYGNSVEIQNDAGGSVMFGHFSVVEVSVGQKVSQGQEIGLMGTTGNSTGSHLHWEFRGIPLAPPYIPQAIIPENCDTPSIACTPASI
jgi:murein DD-endopeptidase MepM/ murein hydrolase activator NlpD